VLPPEVCVNPDHFFKELAKRNIIVSRDKKPVCDKVSVS